MEFLSVDLGLYLKNYLEFGRKLTDVPKIFGVNYFLRDSNGKFLNHKTDKAVWLKWMELRVHNDVKGVETPIGYIPRYEDLQPLFKKVLNRDYSKEDYEKQFTIRIPELLNKNKRIVEVYSKIKTSPEEVFKVLKKEEEGLLQLRKLKGDYVSPFALY